jgi:hypothetical protein
LAVDFFHTAESGFVYSTLIAFQKYLLRKEKLFIITLMKYLKTNRNLDENISQEKKPEVSARPLVKSKRSLTTAERV